MGMKQEDKLPLDILKKVISRELGNITDQEKESLRKYLEAHPDSRDEIETYAGILRKGKQLSIANKINKEKAWIRLSRKLSLSKAKQKPKSSWLKYAAVLLPFILVLGCLFMYLNRKAEIPAGHVDVMASVRETRATLILSSGEAFLLGDSMIEDKLNIEGVHVHKDQKDRIRYADATVMDWHSLRIPRRGEYQLVLPDGTMVWINSGSQLDYPTKFDYNIREVTLEGEAFFNVATETERPFVVNTPGMQITATGTEFNIYSYPGDVAETTLVSGILSVDAGNDFFVELAPGEQARFQPGMDSIHVHKVNTNLYTSWVQGVFSFRDILLEDLAIRMERWYDVNIVFEDPDIKEIRLTGAMEKEKPVEYLVFLIEKTANVRFRVEDEIIFIGPEE